MTVLQTSQVVAEVLRLPTAPNLQTSQLAVEVLGFPNPKAQTSQIAVEVIRTNGTVIIPGRGGVPINDRDVLLQAESPRFTVPTSHALVLNADTTAFSVAGTGVGTPSIINLTATLLGMTGTVTFVASGGSVLTVTGNNATLAFGDMVGVSTVVMVSITFESIVYSSTVTITKIPDGISGDWSRTAYSKTTLTSLASTPVTLTTAGSTSFPAPGTWGAGTVWLGSPPIANAGEVVYQTDGIYSPLAGSTLWSVPYQSSLKVGTLSAITGNVGAVYFDGNGQLTTGGFIGYAWPPAGQYGFYLGPSGLLLGNANNAKYFQVTFDGNIYAPQFNIINGNATFAGALSAASGTFAGALQAATGTFSGTLTAQAIDAVDSINIKGNAVMVPLNTTLTSNIPGNGGWQNVLSIYVPPGPVTQKILGLFFARADYSSTGDVYFKVMANGVELINFYKTNAGADWVNFQFNDYVYSTGSGVTYTVQFLSGNFMQLIRGSLTILGIKR